MPNFLSLPKNNAHDGMTMIELCVAATLMIIIGIGVSVAIRNTTEAFMEKRALQQETQMGLEVMSRLRRDIADAQSIVVEPGGIGLDMVNSDGATIKWVYDAGGAGTADNTIRRYYNVGNEDMTANTAGDMDMFMTCGSPCFSGFDEAGVAATDGSAGMRRIELNDFSVSHTSSNPLYNSEITAGAFETETLVFHWSMGIEFQ